LTFVKHKYLGTLYSWYFSFSFGLMNFAFQIGKAGFAGKLHHSILKFFELVFKSGIFESENFTSQAR